MDTNRKDFYASLITGGVFALLVFFLNPQRTDMVVFRICDSFFVAAVLVLGSGLLVFCRNHGAFDMITYSLSFVFHLHFPWSKKNDKKEEDYAAYRIRKEKERKPALGIILGGLVYLVLALVFLVLYYLTV